MLDVKKPPSEWARKRAAGRVRRAQLIERREAYFDLLKSGRSVPEIAKAMNMSRFAVRRAIDQALAGRRLDAQEDFARLQVARLNKALRCADRSLDMGDLKAIPHFIKVVAELDRYHGLAQPARRAKPVRRAETPLTRAPAARAAPAPGPAPMAEMCAKERLSS